MKTRFKPGDRVEHTSSMVKGTVTNATVQYVWVRWDDGQTGILEYNKRVAFNAYRLLKLKGKGNVKI